MSFINILLVEDDELICESYRRALVNNTEMRIVYETDSEAVALDYVAKYNVDVVILDLELREGDGTSFLAKLKALEVDQPFVVVVTNTVSNVMLSLVRQSGADYIYQKTNLSYTPGKVLSIIKKAIPYKRMYDSEQELVKAERYSAEEEDRVTRRGLMKHLREMGFSHTHTGSVYLQEILFLTVSGRQSVEEANISYLYDIIGKMHNNSGKNIEHAIRTAIESTWKTSSVTKLLQYYPYPWDKNKGKPTNREFIRNMTAHLHMF